MMRPNRLTRLWLKLTQPHSDLSGEDEQRARALASVMLILVVTGLLMGVTLAISAEAHNLRYLLGACAAMSVLMIPYVLARRSSNVVVSLVSAVVIFDLLYVALINNLGQPAFFWQYSPIPFQMLLYFLVPVIVAGLYLSVRSTVLMVIVQTALIVSVNAFIFELPWGLFFVGIEGAFIGAVMLLTLGASMYRSYFAQQQQAILQESETRHRDLLETLFEGILTISNGRIVETNHGLRRMTGYQKEELVSRPFSKLVSSIVPQKEAMSFEAALLHMDGSLIPVEMVARSTYLNAEPVIIYALRDISTRKEAEQILKTANTRLEDQVWVRTAELQFANQGLQREIEERQAAQIALQAHQTQLTETIRREQNALHVTKILLQSNMALTQSLETDEVLNTLLACLGELIPCESANVMLLDANEDTVYIRAIYGYENRYPEAQILQRRIAISDFPSIRRVFNSDSSEYVPDTALDPTWKLVEISSHVKSWLGVPLRTGGRTIGLFSLDGNHPDAFTAQHIDFAEALAAQAAVAIENAQLFAMMNEQSDRLRRVTARELRSIEDERGRISRELHDESGQALTALRISLENVRSLIPMDGRLAADPTLAYEQLDQTAALTTLTMENIRTIAHRLRPAALDDLGLDTALRSYCREFNAYATAQVRYLGVDGLVVPDAIGISLYRLLQESLTNVFKHANARTVDVTLSMEEDVLQLRIQDDGRGFAYSEHSEGVGGMGLIGMKERLAAFNGRVDIESIPGQFTAVIAIVRIEKEQWAEIGDRPFSARP